MADYKITFFFEGEQPSLGAGTGAAVGWTETWYLESEQDISTVSDATDILIYIQMRLRFLPNLYRVTFVRTSQEGNVRNVKVRSPLTSNGYVTTPAAQVTCAILVDFTAPPFGLGDHAHHRRMLIRGLPVSLLSGNVINRADVTFQRLVDFLQYISLGAIPRDVFPNPRPKARRIKFIPATTEEVPISNLTVSPNNVHQITVTAAILPGPNFGRVKIRGVHLPYNVNRVWTQLNTVIGTPNTSILGRSRKVLSGNWSNDGFIQLADYAYGLPDQYLIIGPRVRNTGRPSHLTRGRRNPTV
jgi:hypothetical protein